MDTMMTSEPITSRMAVATLVVGVVGLVLSIVALGLVLGPVALVLGAVALSQISRSEGQQGGKGLAVAGMALGGGALLVSVGMAAAIGLGVSAYMKVKNSDVFNTDRIIAKENAYTKASMTVLGQELAARYPGKTVLVVTPWQGEYMADYTATQVEALTSACEGSGITVVTEALSANGATQADEDMMLMDVSFATPGMFDAAVAKHPGADVVLAMGTLPMDHEKVAIWAHAGEEGHPVLVLTSANIYMMQEAIAKGKVGLVLHHHPEAIYDPTASLPSGVQAMFDERYILITPETVGTVAAMYPELFRERRPGEAGTATAVPAEEVPVEAEAAPLD